MARRRYQSPTPKRRGDWWTIRYWRDSLKTDGTDELKRVRLAPATMSEREVRKVAAEHLRPLNQGLETIGSATNFRHIRRGDVYPACDAVTGKVDAGPLPRVCSITIWC